MRCQDDQRGNRESTWGLKRHPRVETERGHKHPRQECGGRRLLYPKRSKSQGIFMGFPGHSWFIPVVLTTNSF